MFRGSVLVCALLFSAPTLWQALVDQSISVDAALVRFLLAIPVAGVLLGLVRMAMRKQPVPRESQAQHPQHPQQPHHPQQAQHPQQAPAAGEPQSP